jgi:hypothetical protein
MVRQDYTPSQIVERLREQYMRRAFQHNWFTYFQQLESRYGRMPLMRRELQATTRPTNRRGNARTSGVNSMYNRHRVPLSNITRLLMLRWNVPRTHSWIMHMEGELINRMLRNP